MDAYKVLKMSVVSSFKARQLLSEYEKRKRLRINQNQNTRFRFLRNYHTDFEVSNVCAISKVENNFLLSFPVKKNKNEDRAMLSLYSGKFEDPKIGKNVNLKR
ncbi:MULTISPECIES: hypothetical protein [Borreliella]|uniref:Uncharacterized protein n=1 Tax=Borreliella valaisiana VS116 TaxID=445987 RepID=D6RXA8_BORVA|nr:hypothetical protein [Borreliella valaisiana]AIJ29635.1 hypothetical protein P613_01360 [Borreliella valaisiana Tom4006]EEF81702.1 conserved hypothetical protein [Borreliella valaisiana VS116]WLN25077.1 hypothetical protein KJD10_01320 [Borreliella valaisiana]